MGVFQEKNHGIGAPPHPPNTHTHTHTHTLWGTLRNIFILHYINFQVHYTHSIFHVHLLLTVINEYEHVTLIPRIGPFVL